ncbi:hypothetical protein DFH05DRAFT_1524178 [Lentinula detonsa]|uniref:Uncharacterized protein n=1 Tax=Lentinula detonsa TaxID=2804962 RepID=A0A9W8TYS5_9AGAR|nr:hypothetical protein DFH05DRAFT_1524178 [Lentinula detonsa]
MAGRSPHTDAKLRSPTASLSFPSEFFARVLSISLLATNAHANLITLGGSELVYGATLERRAPNENATCEAGFDWADNIAGISPCVLAAATSACSPGGHNVLPLSSGSHYDPPSLKENTANVCQCSWATYNLLSMCTICQGQTSSLFPWVSYSLDCKNLTSSNSYFPSSYSALLPQNATIPLYAQTNPAQWLNGIFNVTEAEGLVNGTLSLQTAAATQKSTSPQTVAIIGGSVGGAIVLLSFFGMLIWAHRRNISRAKASYQLSDRITSSARQSILSCSAMSYINTAGNHGNFISDNQYHSGFPTVEGDSTRSPPAPIPYIKSYFDPSDDVYARRDDLLGHIRRLTTLAASPDSHAIQSDTHIGRYATIPGNSGYTYTAVHTSEELSTNSSTLNIRRPSNPPPYSPGIDPAAGIP